MYSFEVKGGKKLSGEIIPQGAKNEALQVISAVLLTPEQVTITNIPDIIDVNLLIELLGEMNVRINRTKPGTCIFQADNVNIDYLHSEDFKRKSGRLRGSVMQDMITKKILSLSLKARVFLSKILERIVKIQSITPISRILLLQQLRMVKLLSVYFFAEVRMGLL